MHGQVKLPVLAMQARTVAEPIIATVSLMAESGLPCYGYGKPLVSLRERFHLDMTEAQAAAFMRNAISDAYDKVPALSSPMKQGKE